jgi:exonuclease SbcD
VQVVVIAGNHDSAARLEAPRELLSAFDVRVIGALRRGDDGRLVVQELLVPLGGEAGRPAAWCVAIPFLRASDVMALSVAKDERVDAKVVTPGGDDCVLPEAAVVEARAAADPLLDGMRALHDELFAAARALRRPGQALVAMAHGYLVGGALSELSERKVLGGNQHALPLDLFPDDCAYVALGHLHRPQTARRPRARALQRLADAVVDARTAARAPRRVRRSRRRTLAKVWSLRVPRTVPLRAHPRHVASSSPTRRWRRSRRCRRATTRPTPCVAAGRGRGAAAAAVAAASANGSRARSPIAGGAARACRGRD